MRPFAIVVAVDEQRGIGLGGGLPWQLPGDMAHFKRVTSEAPRGKQNAVVMGRKTYASIAPRFRPLASRLNVVLSRSQESRDHGVLAAGSLSGALELLEDRDDIAGIFVIGGGEVYREAMAHPRCGTLFITQVRGVFGCDTHFPGFDQAFVRVTQSPLQHDNGIDYLFEVYEKR